MNLYFRLIRVLIGSLFASQRQVLDTSMIDYRVWPLDCDINLHLTNSRYFALCDLARTYFMGELGILFKMVKRNWLPVAQAQEISYFKPVNPFQRFTVTTRLSHWDEKYWYIEHRFLAKDKLCAQVQVRGLFIQGRNIVPMHDVLALLGDNTESPEKPETVSQWQSLIEAKKETIR